jgi:hypothetical protein
VSIGFDQKRRPKTWSERPCRRLNWRANPPLSRHIPAESPPSGTRTTRWAWFGIRQYESTSQAWRRVTRATVRSQIPQSTSSSWIGCRSLPRAVTWYDQPGCS